MKHMLVAVLLCCYLTVLRARHCVWLQPSTSRHETATLHHEAELQIAAVLQPLVLWIRKCQEGCPAISALRSVGVHAQEAQPVAKSSAEKPVKAKNADLAEMAEALKKKAKKGTSLLQYHKAYLDCA